MQLDISTSLDRRAMRDCLGCFPTGIAVMTALDSTGSPAGLTVNSFASVSLDPPLILWSLRRDSGILPAFQASPGFIVNVLSSSQKELSGLFAGRSATRWGDVAHERGIYGIPRLIHAHAVLECEKHARHEGGDHVIFVGRPVVLTVNPDVSPLVFYRGRYCEVIS